MRSRSFEVARRLFRVTCGLKGASVPADREDTSTLARSTLDVRVGGFNDLRIVRDLEVWELLGGGRRSGGYA